MSAPRTWLYDRAIAALLAEPDQQSAAKKAGVSLRTLQRWQRDPQFSEFQKKYASARSSMLNSAILAALRKSESAVKTLVVVMEGPAVPNTVSKVTAASVLLDFVVRNERLDRIEESMRVLESDRERGYIIPVAESPFASNSDVKGDGDVPLQ